uniref:Uncharacterized protein n=1 Tax=Rhizophora mucronata TaxID=61149 RepID=A0A2P2MNU9_RHIMU
MCFHKYSTIFRCNRRVTRLFGYKSSITCTHEYLLISRSYLLCTINYT